VPANTTATVVLPTKGAAGVTVDGKPPLVRPLGLVSGKAAFIVQSGRYRFVSPLSQPK